MKKEYLQLKQTSQGAFMVADWLEKGGLAPVKHHQPPRWIPDEVPPALRSVFKVAYVPTVTWKTPDDDIPEGTPLTDIDGNAAFVAAASSADFAHCALSHTGRLELAEGAIPPGMMLVDAHPWALGEVGSPLGPDAPKGKIWIPHTVYAVLRDLTYGARWNGGVAGHWPDATVYDSWTADPCRFTNWASAIRDVRAGFVRTGDTVGKEALKLGYSQAVQMWTIEPDPKGTKPEDRKKHNKAWRPDWYHALRGQHQMNMFRRAYQCAVLYRRPPVQVGGQGHYMDGMVFKSDDLHAILALPSSPIRLDETGETLGTFKRVADRYAGIEMDSA